MPPPGQSLMPVPVSHCCLFPSQESNVTLHALKCFENWRCHSPPGFAESVIIANKLIQEWMCIYSSTKEKKNMKSVWWLKLPYLSSYFMWHRQGRFVIRVQDGERSQGQVQGSECLVQEAGQWCSSWGPELTRLAWGACWQEARVAEDSLVSVSASGLSCQPLAISYFLVSSSRTRPKVNEESLTSDGERPWDSIVWLQCM